MKHFLYLALCCSIPIPLLAQHNVPGDTQTIQFKLNYFEGMAAVGRNQGKNPACVCNREVISKNRHEKVVLGSQPMGIEKRYNPINRTTTIYRKEKETYTYRDVKYKAQEVCPNYGFGGAWGFVDQNDELAIPMEYEAAASFRNGRAAVMKNGKWGFIDRENKVIVPFEYDCFTDFYYDFAFVGVKILEKKGGAWRGKIKWKMIDRQGKKLSNKQFDNCDYISTIFPLMSDSIYFSNTYQDFHNVPAFLSTHPCTQLDENRIYVMAIKIDSSLFVFSAGKYANNFGLMDGQGKVIVAKGFNWIGELGDGLIPARKRVGGNDRYGYIDTEGRVKIPFKYEKAEKFVGGYGKVKLKPQKSTGYKTNFYIDSAGKLYEELPPWLLK